MTVVRPSPSKGAGARSVSVFQFFSVLSPIVVMHPRSTIINKINERTLKILKDSSATKNLMIPLMPTISKARIMLVRMVLI